MFFNGGLNSSLILAYLFGAVGGGLAFYQASKDIKLSAKWVIPITILANTWNIAWGRIFGIIEAFGSLSASANLRLYGILFMAPVFFYFLIKIFRLESKKTYDHLSIIVAIGLFCGRIVCIIKGCCKGSVIGLHAFPNLTWPIREAELVFFVLFVIYAYNKIKNNESFGQLYPLLMIGYGLFRIVIEVVRVEYTGIGILHWAYIWSVISILLGYSIMTSLRTISKRKV